MAASNAKDYSIERLRPLIDYFSQSKIELLNRERLCLVAEQAGHIVGTAAIEGQQVCTFFVHPDRQREGIGTALLAALEDAARALGLHRRMMLAMQ